MATAHAYATLVVDDNNGYAAGIATISPGALASELSSPLQQKNPAAFLTAVAGMSSPDGDLELEVAQLNIGPVLSAQMDWSAISPPSSAPTSSMRPSQRGTTHSDPTTGGPGS